MTAKKPLKIRWRRIVTFLIAGYMCYWAGVSVDHMWTIAQQERTLNQRIAAVQEQNRVLTGDIRSLHNPKQLKRILTGQAPLPNAHP